MPPRTPDNCTLRERYGATLETEGRCLGLCYSEYNDEPIDECKECKYQSSYEEDTNE